MHRALAEAQWDDVERLMREEWKLRRTNAPGITTPLIDKLIDVARRNGARAAKVCGAGGGGCVIVFIEQGSRQRVEDAIRDEWRPTAEFFCRTPGIGVSLGAAAEDGQGLAMFTTSTGRLHPVWAFVVSALFSVLAFLVAGYAAGAIAGDRVLLFEVIFRPLLALLLIALFVWMLTVADHVEDHRIAALGLPRAKGWLKQFAIGCLLGFVTDGPGDCSDRDLGAYQHPISPQSAHLAEGRGRTADSSPGRAGRRVDVSRLSLSTPGTGHRRHRRDRGLLGDVWGGAPGESRRQPLGTDQHHPDRRAALHRLPANPSFVAALGHSLRLEFRAWSPLRPAGKRPSAFQRGGADHGERAEVGHRRQLRT